MQYYGSQKSKPILMLWIHLNIKSTDLLIRNQMVLDYNLETNFYSFTTFFSNNFLNPKPTIYHHHITKQTRLSNQQQSYSPIFAPNNKTSLRAALTQSYCYYRDREERTIEHCQALPDSLYRDFGYDVKHSLRSPSTP